MRPAKDTVRGHRAPTPRFLFRVPAAIAAILIAVWLAVLWAAGLL